MNKKGELRLFSSSPAATRGADGVPKITRLLEETMRSGEVGLPTVRAAAYNSSPARTRRSTMAEKKPAGGADKPKLVARA